MNTSSTSRRLKRCGFTLMEVMTALAVFGVIGLLSTQILTSTISLGETTRIRGEALADLQRAMDIIARDVTQLTHRTVRDQLGDPLPEVSITDPGLLELTRLGWQNPFGTPRAELQRVGYVLRDDQLIRLFWPVLDRAPDSKPIAQVLLSGIAEVSFAAYDDQDERHAFWPLIPADDEVAPGLVAVEMSLALNHYGRIERLWLVPSATVATDTDPDSGDPDELPEPSRGQS